MATPKNAKKGCNFDALTSKAVHGKNIIAMVMNAAATEPLAIAGQQDLSFKLNVDTSEAAETKDEDGGWAMKFPGVKSWDASTGGLYIFDDEARKIMNQAMIEGDYLCFGVYKREKLASGGIKYTPVRQGLALVTSDELEASSDDSMTYSCEFEGSGACWCIETATAEEIEAASFTISAAVSTD